MTQSTVKNAQATALLSLWAETSIHAGAGGTTGVIDLPIQRERHSGWPCVFGSAVKGALRAHAEAMGKQGLDVILGNVPTDVVFGPDTNNAQEHAGALAVGDARLLLLPVRSLTGHFKWVTCPALLSRLHRDATRLGITALSKFTIPTVAADQALVPQAHTTDLFLEEYRFQPQPQDLTQLISVLAQLLDDSNAQNLLGQQLCIVADDRFSFFAAHATPVAAHIAIDNATKTTRPGALWYEETLPPETILYTALNAWPARKQAKEGEAPQFSAEQVLLAVIQSLFKDRPYLQLGGNETVGMGWCRVKAIRA